jgi:DNA-directed RNA polymerase subunit RPC12/RpoP
MPALRFKETERGPAATDDKLRDKGIRCPVCRWRPRARDRWQCTCLHVWNTFDTRGVCPACSFRWRETQCLSCGVMSDHEAWYAPNDPT